jgi:putative NADH-flavin reductase
MKLAILGSNGRTGKELVRLATQAGHQVTAITRHPDAVMPSANTKAVKASIFSDAELANVFQGHDAVLSTLGSDRTKPIERSSQAIVAAMQADGVKRLVVELAFGAAESARLSPLFRKLNDLALGSVLDDQRAGVKIITHAALDWTVLFATVLTNGPLTRHYREVSPQEKINWKYKISRADMAQAMLDAVTNHTYSNQQAVISAA